MNNTVVSSALSSCLYSKYYYNCLMYREAFCLAAQLSVEYQIIRRCNHNISTERNT